AFLFVKALKEVNAKLKELYPESEELFKVILISDNSSDSLSGAIRKHGLQDLITPLAVSEDDLISELEGHSAHLYLSAEPGLKVQEALNQGIAAAIMKSPDDIKTPAENQLRVAFDGDAVLFSNESERVFQSGKLQGYLEHEKKKVEDPMNPGPFRKLLEVLERLKTKLQDKGLYRDCPIRTYLVTSRGAGCDGYRALNTLRMWGLEMDEAVFVGGSNKGPTLEKIRPHIFFDDQQRHIEVALEVGTVACHVPTSSQ
ncbi:cytosolic 5'-nucleotidase 1A-like, partial [Stegastes partitus]|uniref:Cytosolic 5'-nucleotidase 1A-like n=1 Tax=Stegastes partitus TaxID=144197 RepID=A0A9Y4NWL8_9TELE